jgi:hypothetical protein
MDFKYRWKNGKAPNQDEAAREMHLLDESQFSGEEDRKLAEDAARRHLNVPLITPDDENPVLPQ